MVDIKDLEIKIPKSFKIKTKNLGELEFRYPTLRQHDIIQKFAYSRKDAKAAFLDLAHSLLINPKLSRQKLTELSDYQLKKIGIILLNSQALKSRYDKIKSKRKFGNFYDKLRKVFKDYNDKIMRPFEDLSKTINRFTFPQLEALQSVSRQIELLGLSDTQLKEMEALSKEAFEAIKLNELDQANIHGMVGGISAAINNLRISPDDVSIASRSLVDLAERNLGVFHNNPVLEDFYRGGALTGYEDYIEASRKMGDTLSSIGAAYQASIQSYKDQIADIIGNFERFDDATNFFSELETNRKLIESLEKSQLILPEWVDDFSLSMQQILEIEKIRERLGPRKVSWLKRILRQLKAWAESIKDRSIDSIVNNRKLLRRLFNVFSSLARFTPELIAILESHGIDIAGDLDHLAKKIEVWVGLIEKILEHL